MSAADTKVSTFVAGATGEPNCGVAKGIIIRPSSAPFIRGKAKLCRCGDRPKSSAGTPLRRANLTIGGLSAIRASSTTPTEPNSNNKATFHQSQESLYGASAICSLWHSLHGAPGGSPNTGTTLLSDTARAPGIKTTAGDRSEAAACGRGASAVSDGTVLIGDNLYSLIEGDFMTPHSGEASHDDPPNIMDASKAALSIRERYCSQLPLESITVPCGLKLPAHKECPSRTASARARDNRARNQSLVRDLNDSPHELGDQTQLLGGISSPAYRAEGGDTLAKVTIRQGRQPNAANESKSRCGDSTHISYYTVIRDYTDRKLTLEGLGFVERARQRTRRGDVALPDAKNEVVPEGDSGPSLSAAAAMVEDSFPAAAICRGWRNGRYAKHYLDPSSNTPENVGQGPEPHYLHPDAFKVTYRNNGAEGPSGSDGGVVDGPGDEGDVNLQRLGVNERRQILTDRRLARSRRAYLKSADSLDTPLAPLLTRLTLVPVNRTILTDQEQQEVAAAEHQSTKDAADIKRLVKRQNGHFTKIDEAHKAKDSWFGSAFDAAAGNKKKVEDSVLFWNPPTTQDVLLVTNSIMRKLSPATRSKASPLQEGAVTLTPPRRQSLDSGLRYACVWASLTDAPPPSPSAAMIGNILYEVDRAEYLENLESDSSQDEVSSSLSSWSDSDDAISRRRKRRGWAAVLRVMSGRKALRRMQPFQRRERSRTDNTPKESGERSDNGCFAKNSVKTAPFTLEELFSGSLEGAGASPNTDSFGDCPGTREQPVPSDTDLRPAFDVNAPAHRGPFYPSVFNEKTAWFLKQIYIPYLNKCIQRCRPMDMPCNGFSPCESDASIIHESISFSQLPSGDGRSEPRRRSSSLPPHSPNRSMSIRPGDRDGPLSPMLIPSAINAGEAGSAHRNSTSAHDHLSVNDYLRNEEDMRFRHLISIGRINRFLIGRPIPPILIEALGIQLDEDGGADHAGCPMSNDHRVHDATLLAEEPDDDAASDEKKGHGGTRKKSLILVLNTRQWRRYRRTVLHDYNANNNGSMMSEGSFCSLSPRSSVFESVSSIEFATAPKREGQFGATPTEDSSRCPEGPTAKSRALMAFKGTESLLSILHRHNNSRVMPGNVAGQDGARTRFPTTIAREAARRRQQQKISERREREGKPTWRVRDADGDVVLPSASSGASLASRELRALEETIMQQAAEEDVQHTHAEACNSRVLRQRNRAARLREECELAGILRRAPAGLLPYQQERRQEMQVTLYNDSANKTAQAPFTRYTSSRWDAKQKVQPTAMILKRIEQRKRLACQRYVRNRVKYEQEQDEQRVKEAKVGLGDSGSLGDTHKSSLGSVSSVMHRHRGSFRHATSSESRVTRSNADVRSAHSSHNTADRSVLVPARLKAGDISKSGGFLPDEDRRTAVALAQRSHGVDTNHLLRLAQYKEREERRLARLQGGPIVVDLSQAAVGGFGAPGRSGEMFSEPLRPGVTHVEIAGTNFIYANAMMPSHKIFA